MLPAGATPRRRARTAGEREMLPTERGDSDSPSPSPSPRQPPRRYLGSQVPAVLRRLLLAGARVLPGSRWLLQRQLAVLGRLPAAGEETPHGAAAAAARRGEAGGGEGLASAAPPRPAGFRFSPVSRSDRDIFPRLSLPLPRPVPLQPSPPAGGGAWTGRCLTAGEAPPRGRGAGGKRDSRFVPRFVPRFDPRFVKAVCQG